MIKRHKPFTTRQLLLQLVFECELASTIMEVYADDLDAFYRAIQGRADRFVTTMRK